MIHSVPTRLVPDLWPALETFVKRACRYHPFMQPKDVREVILWGAARLFIATNAEGVLGFAAIEMVEYPSRRVANVFLAGGKRGFLSVAVNELLPILKQWGREQDADAFSITGRPGWVRALRSQGFESVPHVTLWADYSDGEGRRQQQYTAADDHRGAVEAGPAVPH